MVTDSVAKQTTKVCNIWQDPKVGISDMIDMNTSDENSHIFRTDYTNALMVIIFRLNIMVSYVSHTFLISHM
jgi:hypothetical protein